MICGRARRSCSTGFLFEDRYIFRWRVLFLHSYCIPVLRVAGGIAEIEGFGGEG